MPAQPSQPPRAVLRRNVACHPRGSVRYLFGDSLSTTELFTVLNETQRCTPSGRRRGTRDVKTAHWNLRSLLPTSSAVVYERLVKVAYVGLWGLLLWLGAFELARMH
jgi:hypothetical protein